MKKTLNDFTIKEFEKYVECMGGDTPDVYAIFELFGEDASKLKYDEFEKMWNEIRNMSLSVGGTRNIYKVGNRHFKACLNPLKLSAGQYIDFQTYVKNFKLQQIMSVFLLPMKRSWFFGKLMPMKYNTGYDIVEVQDYLYKHMLVREANDLSAFFLKWSLILTKTMRDYSEKRLMKMRLSQNKQQTTHLRG